MKKRVAILGAGPAGLALALKLVNREDLDLEVFVIEEQPIVGGIASGFEHEGIFFDFGSHRLHPTTAEEIMSEFRKLLGDDLLDRPRNGRIRLRKRFVKFPLKPGDFIFKMPLGFILGIMGNTLLNPFRRKIANPKSYADVLQNGLGKTICESFYFPYAQKLWKLAPEEIAAVQARRRVAANSIGKIIKKVFSVFVPALKKKGAGRFFYPRKGFVQLFDAMMMSIWKKKAQFMLANRFTEMTRSEDGRLNCRMEDGTNIDFDMVFSTIPVTDLVKGMQMDVPEEVKEACTHLNYRGMLFCYLMLNTSQFTPYDAHYFPELEICFSRMSEPKNYSDTNLPDGLTGLCLEIPCDVGGELWNATEKEVAERVINDLEKIGFHVRDLVKESFVKRTRNAYPLYDLEFEKHLETLNKYLHSVEGLVVLGRQGLFAHDNTHHTIDVSFRAAECLSRSADLVWDKPKWMELLEEFKTHVVED